MFAKETADYKGYARLRESGTMEDLMPNLKDLSVLKRPSKQSIQEWRSELKLAPHTQELRNYTTAPAERGRRREIGLVVMPGLATTTGHHVFTAPLRPKLAVYSSKSYSSGTHDNRRE